MLLNSQYIVTTEKRYFTREEATDICSLPHKGGYLRADCTADGGYQFIREYAVCPYCGAQFTAGEVHRLHVQSTASLQDLLQRAEATGSETQQRSVIFSTETFDGAREICCPCCCATSYSHDVAREVITEGGGGAAVVKIRILTVKELISALMTVSDEDYIDYPDGNGGAYYEVLRLCTETGVTTLSIESDTAGTLYTRDITACSGDLHDSCFPLFENPKILGFLLAHLAPLWQTPFPLKQDTVTVGEVILANRFQGFSRDFYNAVPFLGNTSAISPTFMPRLRFLQNTDTALAYFKAAALPDTKTVRTLLFANQWLFFYLPELEKLYAAANRNTDNLITLLKMPPRHLLTLVVSLHAFPSVDIFFRDYLKEGYRAKQLTKMMEEGAFEVVEYAKRYSLLDRQLRAYTAEHDGTLNTSYIRNNFYKARLIVGDPFEDICFAVPFLTPNTDSERVVGDYRFRFLRSNAEARAVGEALNNCLTEWNHLNNPVVVISIGGMPVGAVELTENSFAALQAHLKDNKPMASDPPVYEAFAQWLDLNAIPYDDRSEYQDDDDDDDDELPF